MIPVSLKVRKIKERRLKLALRPMILIFFLVLVSTAGAETFNPKPAERDFILPMPGGASMVFRPVFIGEGDDPFAARRFIIGDPSAGFQEHPKTVVIGGSFLGKHDPTSGQVDWLIQTGRQDWFFYMGKYEVTQAQYYSIMPRPDTVPPDSNESQYPVTDISWFEANQFIDLYNQWLYANARESLPRNGEAIGFLRLPDEVEWEFAARGGSEVGQDDFDRRHPYKGNLAKYEWFAGPKSSHGKVKKIGLLAPNILNIHDMLGNVAEMTHGIFQIEYNQGRSGGFIARGGHFFTSEKDLRSARRIEEPFYFENGNHQIQPNRKSTLGFRLVISTVIFPSMNSSDTLESAWENYRGTPGAGLTETAYSHLSRLKNSLNQENIGEDVRQQLGLLEKSLEDITFVRKKADEESAYSWSRTGSLQGFEIYSQIPKLSIIDTLIKIADTPQRAEQYQARKQEIMDNIENTISAYSVSLRQLEQLSSESINKGFQKTWDYLGELKAKDQMRVLAIMRKHLEAYKKDQRADREKWRTDFQQLLEKK